MTGSLAEPEPFAGPSQSPAGTFEVGIVTLFPELFATFLTTSFVGKAQKAALARVRTFDLRHCGLGRHRSVDDTPYGGGSGMVLRVDCVVNAIEAAEAEVGMRAHRVLMTPQGRPLSAALARSLAELPFVLLVCGRYEGFDERVRSHVNDEISLGDFVLTGGEIAAMAVVEATIRFRPGVLGNQDSTAEESFSDALAGGLEYPQYTRPADFRGNGVPSVLVSGDHARVADWRARASRERTAERRPDLLKDA